MNVLGIDHHHKVALDALWELTPDGLRERLADLARDKKQSVSWVLLAQRGCGRKTLREILQWIGGEPTPSTGPHECVCWSCGRKMAVSE